MRRLVSILTSIVALGALATCSPVGGKRYTRKQAEKSLSKLEAPGVVVGTEFHITKVVDGDTVWVDGLDKSLRLLGIDTEELFHHEENRRAAEKDWAVYLKDQRGDKLRPVKLESPVGEQAKVWAKEWFANVDKVTIERDHPAEIRDRYGRYLAYVVAMKGGVKQVYNVECVRAGMAPYFTKYGYSRRYDKEFKVALAEAKAAKRGIWDPSLQHAIDYPEREQWWNARGDFVDEFRKEGEGKPNYIDVTHWDAKKRLEDFVGKEVHVLSTVDDVVLDTKGPARVKLGEVPLVFFDRDVLGTSGLREWKGEFVVVTGVPSMYSNKHTNKSQVQIQIDRATQIKLSPVPGLTPPTTTVSP
jgi:endonuclease YncB( thermonuclease family)